MSLKKTSGIISKAAVTPAESIGTLILKEADQLAREKCIAPHIIFSCLEQAFQKIAKDAYGQSHDIRASINRHTGDVSLTRHIKVVEEVQDPMTETTLEQAGPDHQLGENLVDDLPMPALNRIAIQNFKSSLTKGIYEVERGMQYDEFKDRVGQIFSGVVKRLEGPNVIVDLGRAEGVILRNELIPREMYRINDRIKCYVYDVRKEPRGPQIFLSRTHPSFLAKLLAQEVPQIYDGLIEIKAVARDPGSRAKVAIVAVREERSFDPIGACVGVRGSRVNAVSQELQGEKIDIIPWAQDLPIFVVNALTPAEVSKVIVERPTHIKVVVPDHQQSIAIGRRGQNVKLAHQLTGVNIEIVTETSEQQQRTQLRQELTHIFMEQLDLSEMMAHLLVSEGFESIQELAQASVEELSELQGISPDVAQELKERAVEAVEDTEKHLKEAFLQGGGAEELINLGVPLQALSCLLAHKVVSLKDLGDLSLGELMEILGEQARLLDGTRWGELILEARTHD